MLPKSTVNHAKHPMWCQHLFEGKVTAWVMAISFVYKFHWSTLPETNSSSHLKIGPGPKRKYIFQPLIFRFELLVSGRVMHIKAYPPLKLNSKFAHEKKWPSYAFCFPQNAETTLFGCIRRLFEQIVRHIHYLSHQDLWLRKDN